MNAPRAPRLFLAAGLLAACTFSSLRPLPPCNTDSDCEAPAICFADGCGNPGQDIKVQVTYGETSQEFEVEDLHGAEPHATFDQELRRPSVLTGSVRQATASGSSPYTGQVTFRATGTALHVGLPRQAEERVLPEQGQYELPLSSGVYTSLVASGADPTIPPVAVMLGSPGTALEVGPGVQPTLHVVFPPVSSLLKITGTLFKVAPVVFAVPMQIQVLDPASGRPLTAPQPVDQDTGGFEVLAPQAAAASGQVRLLAGPASATSGSNIIPQVAFDLSSWSGPVFLETGQFGTTVEVSGTVLGPDSTPINGATVYIEGKAQGGGTFRTDRGVTTSGSGAFTLRSLPSPLDGAPVTLWVVPPPGSPAGRFKTPVVVPLQGGPVGVLHSPPRVTVKGTVYRPDGKAPASGVEVRATPVRGLDGNPTPSFVLNTETNPQGEFSFVADPGDYQLEFVPADNLPRVGRRVRVEVVLNPQGDPIPVKVPAFTLWNGRRLTGLITGFMTPSAPGQTPLPGAVVEFFRVTTETGEQVIYPLARGVTDSNGRYDVLLPTAPSPAPTGSPDAG